MSEIKQLERRSDEPVIKPSLEQLGAVETTRERIRSKLDEGLTDKSIGLAEHKPSRTDINEGFFESPELQRKNRLDNCSSDGNAGVRHLFEGTATAVIEESLSTTRIDDKVKPTEKERLPRFIQDSFANGEYRTVVANEEIRLYRTFGGQADAGGAFATTERSSSEMDTRQKLALLPEWGNTCRYELEITVPQGEKFNLGKVEKQTDTRDGTVYRGGGDQILLPQNWFTNHPEWITDIYTLKENDDE